MRVTARFVAVPMLALTLALTAGAARAENLMETVESSAQFGIWASAVEAAGLSDQLAEDGPYTVFAPTNEAFARLPAGSVEALLKPENHEQLVRLVAYHLAKGRFASERLEGRMTQIESLQGDVIEIEGRYDELLVDAAEAVETDIPSSNGVIHAIDNVILPEWQNPAVKPRAGTRW
ncbi:fasciclin domain-containing protein [Denitrobaculum tricleocarpae]|uniref:Fasciclin domain-containing protein n=1 Tax=Denitrobaculum tricleocarpae TaxID=2591009 RepID=A0A545TKP9_9PROT|nr:fasciclin domain-containing protein [Denitrobaculum tricleocarpae]TQV77741.1 fasciclin domain-containing protein [Denitrobaculum tricleocarpae]